MVIDYVSLFRVCAADVFRQLGVHAAQAVPTLAKAIVIDAVLLVRVWAAEALGKLGELSVQAAPTLAQTMEMARYAGV
jgi:hypothetical protein